MQLTRLEAEGFRNLRGVGLDLPAGVTLVVGANAQGKTSLLEAAYLLAAGPSFRTRRLEDVVAWGEPAARVAGTVAGRHGRTRLSATVGVGTRSLCADGAEQDLESFLGRLDVVDLTGERIHVLRGPPDERRRFLDRGALGLRAGYLRVLGRYRRALAQRNALLRRARSASPAEIAVWDQRLTEAGGCLHAERRAYAEALGAVLGDIGARILPAGSRLTLRYVPSPATAGDEPTESYAAILGEGLARSLPRDTALGHTTRGPHRDEVLVELDGVDLRRFGSAGQVRAAMVALKLGKLSLLREKRGEPPLFLMDDFDTDLDEVRASALADFLRQGGFQALVATSKETLVGRLGGAAGTLRMNDGAATAA
jgi:DNA replication and repair protein RecF